MSTDPQGHVRTALQEAVVAAMKRRDRAATAVYRTALGAVDNAAAVPLRESDRAGAVEASRVGVGAADAPRRELTEDETAAVVRGEAAERRTAADDLDGVDPDTARRLRDEAALLDVLLADARV